MTIPSALQTMQRPSLTLHITKKEPYRRGRHTLWRPAGRTARLCVARVHRDRRQWGIGNQSPLFFWPNLTARGLAPYDSGHLLPGTGLLSFFYETGLQPWGFDPHDAGCARVFWFPDAAVLDKALSRAGLPEEARFPIAEHPGNPGALFSPIGMIFSSSTRMFPMMKPFSPPGRFWEHRYPTMAPNCWGGRIYCKIAWQLNVNCQPGG